MARAFFERECTNKDCGAESAGSQPAQQVWPEVIEVMREVGIDPSREKPKRLTVEMQLHADWAVTMGCGDLCPYVPLRPKRHPHGTYRFDAPRDGAEYPVTYANLAGHGAFAEVYGDTQLISERETDRRFSTLIANRSLRLIALDGPTVQKTLRLDGRIAMSKQYATTMLWSRALHLLRHRVFCGDSRFIRGIPQIRQRGWRPLLTGAMTGMRSVEATLVLALGFRTASVGS